MGIDTVMTVDEFTVSLRLGDTELGTWDRRDVEFRPWETVSMILDGETWLYTPRRPKDFVAAIESSRTGQVQHEAQDERASPLSDRRVVSSVLAIGTLAIVVAFVFGGVLAATAGFIGGVTLTVSLRSLKSIRSGSRRVVRRVSPRSTNALHRTDDDFIHGVGSIVSQASRTSPGGQDAEDAAARERHQIDLRLEAIAGDDPRNLTRVHGIGERYSQLLWRMGIYTIVDLASVDDDTIGAIERALGEQRDRLHRDDWIGQAKRLAEELSTTEQTL
ncbi:MAG: hypothetical protein R3282_01760 [Rhodothermales bacterium]|nr:hypothetical protein [Rhodothermales bacterium]